MKSRYNSRYTNFLKTAISLPESLFRQAEAAARKLKMSRSQLYGTALAEFLERRRTDKITERLNEIYSETPAKVDPSLHSAHLKSLRSESW
jgi:metal-responsive CopG/Arc/MetJ family transcriptional regulator